MHKTIKEFNRLVERAGHPDWKDKPGQFRGVLCHTLVPWTYAESIAFDYAAGMDVDVAESYPKEYSENECKLLAALGLLPGHPLLSLGPLSVYKILADRCFIEDRRGFEVDALRRALKAIRDCSPYRETPEWEKIIAL